MRYLILGTTEARDDHGDPLPLGGPRIRALLAALAVRAARSAPVSVDVLIDEVWADDPPHDAPAALQALVGRLRRTIGRDGVISSPGGYRLATATPQDDVDLLRFERLTNEGIRALDADDPGTAAATLRKALALWRGPALADLPDRDAPAARPEALRLTALHRRIDADLALDHATDVIPELRQLVADHPLDETFHAQLIRALRAAGHSADALAAYEDVRRTLADRLGTDPGAELKELHRRLLTMHAEPALGAPDAARGDAPTTEAVAPRADGHGGSGGGGARADNGTGWAVNGRGGSAPRGGLDGRGGSAARGRFESQARGAFDGQAGGAFDSPAGRGGTPDGARSRGDDGRGVGSGTAVPPLPHGNLRARLNSFVGRRNEIGDIVRDLDGARLVTLTGPGGSGKTRLSEEAAATVTASYPDGVWVAELAPLDHPSAVPGAVLSAVGRRATMLLASGLESRTTGPDGGDPTSRLVEYCADRRLLLLLDNCEHVIDTAARLTETLLAHCPGVTVLATSREPLGVPGETVRPVEPLAPAPAHQLFAERAATVRPGFDPAADPDTAAAVAEICRRLDGLPLAIELAAARLRLLTPRQIADRLDDRFRLLTSGSRTALPRQQTLRAVVEWSWDLLDERERTVLRRASVFAGGWTLSAAEAVCADALPGESVLTVDTNEHRVLEDGVLEDSVFEHGVLEAGVDTRDVLTDATASTPEPGDTVAYDETRSPTRSPAHPQARIAPAEVLELLGALVDKSLLIVDHPSHGAAADSSGPPSGEPRYRMLETIHEYVGNRATEDRTARADHKAAVARHTAHFRDFIRTAEPRLRSAEQLPWLLLVETDLDNIRAALHRSLTIADEDTVIALIRALAWFWWLRNYRDEGAAWVGRALALLARPHGTDAEADRIPGGNHALDQFLHIPARVPDGEDGVDAEATRYWQRMDLRLMFFVLLAEQGTGPDMSDPAIRDVAIRMRDAYAGHPGPRSASFPGLLWPFTAFVIEGFAGGMLPLMDQTVATCRTHGDDWALGITLMYRTHLSIDMPGGIETVDDDLAELRELTTRVGDRWLLAQVEGARGEIATHHGRFAEARAAYEKALRLAQELGAHTEVPFLCTRLADLALHERDLEGALKLVVRSEEAAERCGTQDVRAFNQIVRSEAELLRGDLARARTYCDAAWVRAGRGTPPPQFWVVAGGLDGRITGLEGDLVGGLRKLRNTLREGFEANSMELLLAHQAESAADLLVRCGQERLAVRLLGAADGWRGRLPRSPMVAADVGATAARASEALGQDAVEKLRTENTAMTPEQAICLLDEVLTSLDATAAADVTYAADATDAVDAPDAPDAADAFEATAAQAEAQTDAQAEAVERAETDHQARPNAQGRPDTQAETADRGYAPPTAR